MKASIVAFVIFLMSGIAHASTYEYGWDRPGYDYANFDLASPRFILCEWRCENDGRCRA